MFLPICHDAAIEVFINVSSDFTTHSSKVFFGAFCSLPVSLCFSSLLSSLLLCFFFVFMSLSLLVGFVIYTLGRLRFIDWIPSNTALMNDSPGRNKACRNSTAASFSSSIFSMAV